MHRDADVLEVDPVTGRRTGLTAYARRVLRALGASEIPYALVGATALAVRGLPRMTRDVDVVVLLEDAFGVLGALQEIGFSSLTPIARDQDPEPMYVLKDRQGNEVDVLVAAGEPESTIVAEAPSARAFGVKARVATLEHLVLMYLYSNQARHLGDLARIVTETDVDLEAVERYLSEVHPEMLAVLAERVHMARHPAPPPPRPKRRR